MKRWIALVFSLLLALAGSVQAEEPHQNVEIKTIMERYKQGAEFERIPSMTAEQRGKLMAYYHTGKAAGVKDRLLATGMGSIVAGYSDIDAVRAFVETYQKTGKMGKYLPLPHVSFTNAAEKFPEAQTMFASELEATKKMEAQIKSILEAITQDAERRTQDAERRIRKAQEDIKLLQQILNAIK